MNDLKCIPKTKEELLYRQQQLEETCKIHVKEALKRLSVIKEVFFESGLGDAFFERSSQAEALIKRPVATHVSFQELPRTYIKYNILIESYTKEYEEYLGQFVPSAFNFIRKLVANIDREVLKLEKPEGSEELKQKVAITELMAAHAKFVQDRREKFLIEE